MVKDIGHSQQSCDMAKHVRRQDTASGLVTWLGISGDSQKSCEMAKHIKTRYIQRSCDMVKDIGDSQQSCDMAKHIRRQPAVL
jgi:hypothetical protein